MLYLRNHLVRYGTQLSKQNFLHCMCVQNQKKAKFHLGVSLLERDKQVESAEGPPNPDDGVWIGPPHPVSQLRLKVFPKSENLSEEEKTFYSQCKETQEWNHQYWEAHNKDFHESRNLFMDKMAQEKNITRDEVAQSEDMAHFYQHFLKRNYSKHIAYNWNWYKKNLQLLYLNARANVSKLKRIFRK